MPAVSVVMAVRNGEEYLREAVDSILGQTFGSFEFVVVDDGSTDTTGEILMSYDDPRLRVLTCASRGLAPSLNAGIHASQGQLVARMDADDISEPHRLERQAAFLNAREDHVLVGSDVHVIAESGEFLFRADLVTDDEGIQSCLDRLVNPFYHGAVMFRHDAVNECGLYDEQIPQQVEDILLWLRLRRLGAMASIPEPLYRYRFHANSLSRQTRALLATKARVIRDYDSTGRANPDDVTQLTAPTRQVSRRESRAAYELDLGKVFLDQTGDLRRARHHLVRAVLLAPLSIRAWFNLVLSLSPRPVRLWRIRQRDRRIHFRAGRTGERCPHD